MVDNKSLTGDWNDAARKSEQTWDKEPGKDKNAPTQSIEESMERTEEGYGSGKEGADPKKDDDGTTSANPAG
ncbi:hypothetical protein [Muricoccus aerilatus]|uniref:hypothetical protein n=1 Tax=Muricoccus aerilatus TaxID=452982 RepID=UPI0005C14814|nr:hypothetical protein [Roseomonas aerilata]